MDQDAQLMLELKKGDVSAFEEIMRKYKRNVASLAYRYLQNFNRIEDVVQEVFLRIYNSAGKYKSTAKLSTWIYKITINVCLNQIRSQKRVQFMSLENLENLQIVDHNALEEIESEQRIKLIKAAIQSLPERQRIVVVLQRYEGKSYGEIAEILGCSVAAVDSLAQRAKQYLKNKLLPLWKDF
ncbi:RNA polymerase sigma factor [bacterium]|nr:RNA polymerase sigma factor [bacterium]